MNAPEMNAPEMNTRGKNLVVGQKVRATIEKIAHGGHFIARVDGAVIFVRHALPGEDVTIAITDITKNFARGDVIEVHSPSADRVTPPCTYAGTCGGCDFQHISYQRQRALKAEVITEQFQRLAKMDVYVEVEECGPPLGWRVRATATADAAGKIGFYAHRTHTVIPVTDCKVMHPSTHFVEVAARQYSAGEKVLISPDQGSVAEKSLELSQDSFWQGHINAPHVLVDAVANMLEIKAGDHIFDLYGGVGLFTSALAQKVGPGGRIDLIEGNKSAVADAKKNFADVANVFVHLGSVEKIISKFKRADLVLLDPPREGAHRQALAGLMALAPREILYISCDPAALARDTAILRDGGYIMDKLRAFDLFPMTHHIESIALYRAMR